MFATSASNFYFKRVQYYYNYETQQCIQRPIEYPFRPFGVPANATALGQGTIGASGVPGAGVLVSSFAGYPSEGENNLWNLNWLEISSYKH